MKWYENLLTKISIGKYNTGLYFKGSLQYSSIFGGILTIVLMILFIIYVVTVIQKIFFTDYYSLVTRIEDLFGYDGFKENPALTLGSFDKNFIDSFEVVIENKYNVTCDQIFAGYSILLDAQAYYSKLQTIINASLTRRCRFKLGNDIGYQQFISNRSSTFAFDSPYSSIDTKFVYKVWYWIWVPKNLTTF